MQVRALPIDGDRRETTRHGATAFPAAVYHSVMSRNALGYTPWHWHDEIQLCLVTAGRINFSIHERQYLLETGDGMFINSGYLHMARPEGDPDSAYLCLDVGPRLLVSFHGSVFEERYVTPFLKDPSMEALALRRQVPWQREALDDVGRACRVFGEKGFGYEFTLTALVARVWLSLLSHRAGGTSPDRGRWQDNAAVRTILAYLHENYGEALSVDAIAGAVAFSGSECCRAFKRVTGETIFGYLQAYRVSRAAELLRDTDMPISQIAYETGFCCASYFIKVFRGRMGRTPLQYRKSVQG